MVTERNLDLYLAGWDRDMTPYGADCEIRPNYFMYTCPVTMKRRLPGMSWSFEERCNKIAKRYKVSGDSFSCYQELCPVHAEKARKEKFILEEVSDDDIQS